MAVESKTQIKTYFETGDIPTQAQFENLIDSLAHEQSVKKLNPTISDKPHRFFAGKADNFAFQQGSWTVLNNVFTMQTDARFWWNVSAIGLQSGDIYTLYVKMDSGGEDIIVTIGGTVASKIEISGTIYHVVSQQYTSGQIEVRFDNRSNSVAAVFSNMIHVVKGVFLNPVEIDGVENDRMNVFKRSRFQNDDLNFYRVITSGSSYSFESDAFLGNKLVIQNTTSSTTGTSDIYFVNTPLIKEGLQYQLKINVESVTGKHVFEFGKGIDNFTTFLVSYKKEILGAGEFVVNMPLTDATRNYMVLRVSSINEGTATEIKIKSIQILPIDNTVGDYLTTVVEEVSKTEINKSVKTIRYVSSTGSDTNLGIYPEAPAVGGGRNPLEGPYATIQRALQDRPEIIYLVAGTYENEPDLDIPSDLSVKIIAPNGRAIFYQGGKVDGDSMTQNALPTAYQIANSDTVEELFQNDEGLLLSEQTSIANVAANEGTWFHDGSTLYVNPQGAANPSGMFFYYTKNKGFTTTSTNTPGTSSPYNSPHVEISGVEVRYGKGAFILSKCSFLLTDCHAFGCVVNGFGFQYAIGRCVKCSANHNIRDGFNVFWEATIHLEDCEAFFNKGNNDGYSYHKTSKGALIRCEAGGNSKYDFVDIDATEVEWIDCVSYGAMGITGRSGDATFVNGNVEYSGQTFKRKIIGGRYPSLIVNNSGGSTLELEMNNVFVEGELFVANSVLAKLDRVSCSSLRTSASDVEIKRCKMNNGTIGLRQDSGVVNIEESTIINCDEGIQKNGGTLTVGTANNLYNNTSDYTGSNPVATSEQNKNLSFASV